VSHQRRAVQVRRARARPDRAGEVARARAEAAGIGRARAAPVTALNPHWPDDDRGSRAKTLPGLWRGSRRPRRVRTVRARVPPEEVRRVLGHGRVGGGRVPLPGRDPTLRRAAPHAAADPRPGGPPRGRHGRVLPDRAVRAAPPSTRARPLGSSGRPDPRRPRRPGHGDRPGGGHRGLPDRTGGEAASRLGCDVLVRRDNQAGQALYRGGG
jgi:hypothetical protein